ncbi:MAG: YeeE/YedE family protein [Hyphomicrobiaceae bacterium]|nr:YeeE/YedE family protein [Hyphomicrobiaceae bacterium]
MIQAAREVLAADAELWLALGGLAVGLAFGAVITRTNYCAMGALADVHNFGDTRRFRAWILASATALAGTQLLALAGIVDLSRSMYLAPTLNWFGNIAGGVIFGFGMVFAGGCPSRNLARAGAGDLRALVTLLVLGIAAYATIGGLLAPPRAALEGATSIGLRPAATQSLADLLAAVLPVSASRLSVGLSLLLALAALAYVAASAAFRASPLHILSGLGVGLCVVAGWAVTGLAFDEMATRPLPPVSLTYVRPAGDTLEWLQRFTAAPVPGFGVASVLGALLGALAVSVWRGQFRVQTFADAGDTRRSLGGAVLMGLGGVMAMGCTVGQSLTGVSTLALGSFLTFGAIVLGGRWGLVVLERRILAGA